MWICLQLKEMHTRALIHGHPYSVTTHPTSFISFYLTLHITSYHLSYLSLLIPLLFLSFFVYKIDIFLCTNYISWLCLLFWKLVFLIIIQVLFWSIYDKCSKDVYMHFYLLFNVLPKFSRKGKKGKKSYE